MRGDLDVGNQEGKDQSARLSKQGSAISGLVNGSSYNLTSDDMDGEMQLSDNSMGGKDDDDPYGTINMRNLSQAKKYERKLAKMTGQQIKFKKSDFLVYMKKHPTYTTPTVTSDSISRSNMMTDKQITKVTRDPSENKMTSFILDHHTISEEVDEESNASISLSPLDSK